MIRINYFSLQSRNLFKLFTYLSFLFVLVTGQYFFCHSVSTKYQTQSNYSFSTTKNDVLVNFQQRDQHHSEGSSNHLSDHCQLDDCSSALAFFSLPNLLIVFSDSGIEFVPVYNLSALQSLPYRPPILS
jgi:hypothetical protein